VELSDLGERWHLSEAAFKLLPCCHFIHPFVEALGEALDTGITPGDVASIHCYVPRGAAPIIAEPWASKQHPASAHDVRWSLPYVLAARVVDGGLGLDLFDAPIGDDRLRLSLRVTHEIWDDSGFPAVFPARLTVTTHAGRTVEAAVDDVVGGAGRPIAPEVVVVKARHNLMAAGLAPGVVDELVTELLETESPDAARVGALLRRG
jgi:2-methylcitrate dehydratase PrpD